MPLLETEMARVTVGLRTSRRVTADPLALWPEAYRQAWERGSAALPKAVAGRAQPALGRLFAAGPVVDAAAIAQFEAAERSRGLGERAVYQSLRDLRAGLDALDTPELPIALRERATAIRRAMAPSGPKRLRSYAYSKSLAFQDWPESERRLWAAARARGDHSYAPKGALADMADGTVRSLASAYGRWLLWCRDSGIVEVNEAGVDAYIRHLEADPNVGSRYLAHLLYRLYVVRVCFAAVPVAIGADDGEDEFLDAALLADAEAEDGADFLTAQAMTAESEEEEEEEFLDPATLDMEEPGTTANLLWLRTLALARYRDAPPPDKSASLVDLPALLTAGLRALQELMAAPVINHAWAVAYRDALMVVFVGCRCVRLANLAQMRLDGAPDAVIGRVDLEARRVTWPGAAMKNRAPFTVSLPAGLMPWIDLYLSKSRRLLDGGSGSTAFWVSGETGRALAPSAIEQRVTGFLARALGRHIPVHRIRDINAMWVAETYPTEMWIATGLLGHIDPRSIKSYVQLAGLLAAQKVLADLLADATGVSD